MKGTDLSSTHSFKAWQRQKLPLGSFCCQCPSHFSGNSSWIGCSGWGSKPWCPPFPSLRGRHRTQQNQTLSFWNQSLGRDKKVKKRGCFCVAGWGSGWGELREDRLHHFLLLSSQHCPGSHCSELALTILVPSFCAFRSARVRFGSSVTWPAGALRVWPCLSASVIWPPPVPPPSPCAPAALTLCSSLGGASLFLLPGLSLALQPECHLLKEAIADHPKTLYHISLFNFCYLSLFKIISSFLSSSLPSLFLSSFHLHFPIRMSALRR